MKRTMIAAASACLVLAAGAVLALEPGATVYVRSQDTFLKKAPRPGAEKVRTKALPPGAKLTWLEQSKDAPQYHRVKAGKLEGWVWYQSLSTTAPRDELVIEKGEAKTVDARAFASYGAAARGLSPASKETKGEKAKVSRKALLRDFAVLEKVAAQTVEEERHLDHARDQALAVEAGP